MTYVPLGIRTEFSFLEGMCRIEALVERARNLRLPVIGIADVHSAYGFVPFDVAARAAGVRPLLGATVRLQLEVDAPDLPGEAASKLVLMPRDLAAHRNLLRLLSQSNLESAGAEPVVSWQDLQRHASGLVALDGGMQGPVARALARGMTRGAERLAARLRELFGADAFYIEVQRHGAPEEILVEPSILRLARTLNIPLVATNDVRYLDASDAEAYDVLCCIRSGHALDDPARPRLATDQHFLKSDLQMRQLFRDLPEALANTCVVAQQCRVELDLGTGKAPEYRTDSGRASRDELRHACEKGAARRYGTMHYQALPVTVRDRLAHELAVIEEKELASCFLIVQDVVRYAKQEGIPVGPGRGSAAGSLVCFVLGITEIDPLAHGLVFERFLSRGSASLLDFDLDVGHRRRDDLVRYARRRFGADCVANITSLVTLSAPAAVREVGRVLGIGPDELEDVSRSLRPEEPGPRQVFERSKRLQHVYQEDARVRRLLDVARRLEGLPRYPALHAGGLVISRGPVTDHVALQRTANGDAVAQVIHAHAEVLGLLRIDLVASRFLTAMQGALETIEREHGVRIEIPRLPLDDAETLRMLARGDASCVFQLEGAGVQNLLRRLQPACFSDIVAVLSLFRPGPLAAGLVERYLQRRTGREPVLYAHADLEPVLGETYGLLLYPEQVLRVAVAIADYDMEQAEVLRRVLQRRQIGELARERALFLRAAVEHGVPVAPAEQTFDALLRFNNHGFNKAHSTAYAMLAYAAAYLRAHWPAEYAAALLENSVGAPQRLPQILADAAAHGVAILDVDVNRSGGSCAAEAAALRLGFAQLRRFSEHDVQQLLDERQARGPFRSLFDFCDRMRELPRRSVESLIKAGAFGGLGLSRAQAFSMLEDALRAAERGGAAARPLQLRLDFGDAVDGESASRGEVDTAEFPEAVLAEFEREALVVSVHRNPLLRHAGLWVCSDVQTSEAIQVLRNGDRLRVAGRVLGVRETRTQQDERMAFVDMEDLHGRFEVVAFPALLACAGTTLAAGSEAKDSVLIIDGRLERRKEAARVVAESIELAPAGGQGSVRALPGQTADEASHVWRRQDGGSADGGGPLQPNAERRAGSPQPIAAQPHGGAQAAPASRRRHLRPVRSSRTGDGRRSASGGGVVRGSS